MNRLVGIVIESYRFLLRAFPNEFREEFGEEMLADFASLAACARERGIYALIVFCLRELLAVPANLLELYWEKQRMTPVFPPGAARSILRMAAAFGLAHALHVSGGIVAFLGRRQLHAGGDPELLWLSLSNLFVGPVLASVVLLIFFPEMRPVKRYLPVTVLVFAIPVAVSDLRLLQLEFWPNSGLLPPVSSILAVGYVTLIGLGFGVLAGLVCGERRKIPSLWLAGSIGYFFISWASALLNFSDRAGQGPSAFFGHGIWSVGIRNLLMGMAVGLLLGLILEFKKKENSAIPA